MIKQKLIRILVIPAVVFLATVSCGKRESNRVGNVLYYSIANHTNSRIKVVFYDFWDNHKVDQGNNDSVVYYEPGEKRDLLVVYNISWASNPETDDSLSGIHVLKIFKNETFPAQKNYLLRRYWVYEVIDDYKSEMSLEITNTSFIP